MRVPRPNLSIKDKTLLSWLFLTWPSLSSPYLKKKSWASNIFKMRVKKQVVGGGWVVWSNYWRQGIKDDDLANIECRCRLCIGSNHLNEVHDTQTNTNTNTNIPQNVKRFSRISADENIFDAAAPLHCLAVALILKSEVFWECLRQTSEKKEKQEGRLVQSTLLSQCENKHILIFPQSQVLTKFNLSLDHWYPSNLAINLFLH